MSAMLCAPLAGFRTFEPRPPDWHLSTALRIGFHQDHHHHHGFSSTRADSGRERRKQHTLYRLAVIRLGQAVPSVPKALCAGPPSFLARLSLHFRARSEPSRRCSARCEKTVWAVRKSAVGLAVSKSEVVNRNPSRLAVPQAGVGAEGRTAQHSCRSCSVCETLLPLQAGNGLQQLYTPGN